MRCAYLNKRQYAVGGKLVVFVFLILLAAHWGLVRTANAHEVRPIIATMGWTPDSRFELTLSLNLEAAIAGIGSDHKDTDESSAAPDYERLRALQSNELQAEFETFLPILNERMEISINGNRLVFEAGSIDIPDPGDLSLPRISKVTLIAPEFVIGSSLLWRFDPMLGDSVMRLRDPDGAIVRAELLSAGAKGGPFALDDVVPQTFSQIFVTYFKLGFIHIVPRGIDHMLFVGGLFLLSTRLSPLLWQVSAFTVAHTFTLALGAAGVVSVPPSIVEPLIAASIIYVAVENIFTSRLHYWRLPVVFGFGLLHGLGFAGVLGDIGVAGGWFATSLIAFNLGVEAGQIAVIAAAFLAIGWAATREWYHRLLVTPASIIIALVAFGWFLQRIDLI